jgi:mannosylfructose-phosphate synthase
MPAGLAYDEQRYYPMGPAARQRLRAQLGFRGKVILAIGAGQEWPRLEGLIEAFGLVARRDPTAVLHLAALEPAAPADERRLLTRLVRRVSDLAALGDRVRLTAVPSPAERPNLMRAADVFAPCGDGLAAELCALEAMACGTPTVLSIHGVLQRTFTFGRHALHADPGDSVDFGLTLVKALKDAGLWLRLARMGAHQARSFFTLTGLAQALDLSVGEELPAGFSREVARASA